MLYLYDRAIVDDLISSFTDKMGNSVVKVIDPEAAIDVVSQISNDEFKFPAVVITRDSNYSIDTNRMNFTRLHRGVSTVIDKETNIIYDEKVLPVNLNYNMTVLGTNTADMDELTRELMFKYYQMYFLKIDLPYESDRSIRFGITLDQDSDIEQSSRLLDYLQTGKVYQNILHFTTQGCVLITYNGRQLMNYRSEIAVSNFYRNNTITEAI